MINIKRDFILTSLNMNNKNNIYNTSIATATVIGSITFYLKLLVILNLLLPMILISTILGKLFPVIRNWLPVMFYRLLIWLLSIKIEYEGNFKNSTSCNLFVSNHISYLDIPILGSMVPLRFVAKSEVKHWPILGFLSKLASTIFIKRVRSDSLFQKNKIFNLLSEGKKLLIFPEGTTSDGNRVLPFKSSLFSALENKNFIIQPLIIIYSDLNGMPINRWLRPIIAWYGDMELMPHLSILKNIKSIDVKIIYLKPVNTINFSNRKELSNHLEQQIHEAYSAAGSRKKFAE